MSELREARLVHVSFARSPGDPPSLPDLKVTAWAESEASFEIRGELTQLLGWLAGHHVRDLRIEPLGLSSIYQLYHGAEQ